MCAEAIENTTKVWCSGMLGKTKDIIYNQQRKRGIQKMAWKHIEISDVRLALSEDEIERL